MYIELEKIVSKALEGDEDSRLQLLEKLRPLILSHSKKYGGRQGMDEDMYQEGILEILEGLKDYDRSKNVPFLGYISLRLRYYYENRRRREKTIYSLDKNIGGGQDTSFLDFIEDENVKIEDNYLELERNREIFNALNSLTKNQKYIIVQYYFYKKPLKEIAMEKGVHHVTISKTKAAALKKLKKLLEI